MAAIRLPSSFAQYLRLGQKKNKPGECKAADGLAMPCVAFCNEDGKRLDLPVNWLATGLWHDALVRKGSRFGVLAEGGGYEDYLVGVIVVISGDSKLMDELFIRLP